MAVRGLAQEHNPMEPGEYLAALDQTGLYAMTRGGPTVVRWHIRFLHRYNKAWLDRLRADEDAVPHDVTQVRSVYVLYARTVLILLGELIRSLLNSVLDIMRAGVRGIPPLITAVVVVFVTSDAWKIFGIGFTARFGILVTLLLLTSFCFLAHWNPWPDLCAEEAEAALLLDGIRHKQPMKFYEFTRRGIQIVPMVKPQGLSALRVRLSYWTIVAFALIVFAGLVSLMLILIGVVIITRQETTDLAGFAHVCWTLPGGAVVTTQLLSLSFSLGALAPLFLVAVQRPEDRNLFMQRLLVRYRRALLVYSVYCRAQAWSGLLTDVQIPEL